MSTVATTHVETCGVLTTVVARSGRMNLEVEEVNIDVGEVNLEVGEVNLEVGGGQLGGGGG